MDAAFIEATLRDSGRRTLINVEEIAQIFEGPRFGTTIIYMKGTSDNDGIVLDKGYDDLLKSIKSALQV